MLSSAQARKEGESGVFGVVLVPSRELAQQIQRVSSRLAQSSKLRCVVLTKASATGDDFTQVDQHVSKTILFTVLYVQSTVPGVKA